ncbi:sigma-70 family RNA polymerase sigma factor [Alcaligenes faecalis]|nr:sigma-70 family RNA polymerase sigma factor [Alcaligenes faecalis]
MNERSTTEVMTVAQMQQHMHVLYCQHRGWLHDWLRRRLGCSHHAADLVHDAYVRVMSSGRIPGPEQARPHLKQIAKGLVIDRYRRQQIEQAYLDALAHMPEPTAISPEERALTLEVLLRICAALDGLPGRVQHVFLLSRYEGLTYSAIAQRQGIAVATVRKYMLQATQACFAVMADLDASALP